MSAEQFSPCRKCETATSHHHLSTFGGQCFPCYQRWLHAKPAPTPDVGDKKANGPRDWIRALALRDPKTLTQFQRDALTEARGSRASTEDPQ